MRIIPTTDSLSRVPPHRDGGIALVPLIASAAVSVAAAAAHARELSTAPVFIVPVSTALRSVALPKAAAPSLTFAQPPGASDQPQSFLADQIDLPRLVDLAAQRLKISIDYDSTILKGQVTLRLSGSLSDDELWALTNKLLVSRGFTTIRTAGESRTYSVVRISEAALLTRVQDERAAPDASALTSPAPEAVPRQATEPAPGYTAVVVRINHRPLRDITDAVRLMLSKQSGSAVEIPVAGNAAPAASGATTAGGPGSGTASGIGGLLLLSDLAPRIDQVLALIARLDTPMERIVVEEVPLKHLSSNQMSTLFGQVTAKQSLQSGRKTSGEVLSSPVGGAVLIVAPESHVAALRQLIDQLDQREPVEAANYAPRYFGIKEVAKLIEQTIKESSTMPGASDERLKVVPDELTGTLIVTATPSQHERIAALIQRLDNVSPAARRPVRTFVVKNRPVREIVEVVRKLMEAGVIEAGGIDEGAPAGQIPTDRSINPAATDGANSAPSASVAPIAPAGGTASTLLRPDGPRDQSGLPRVDRQTNVSSARASLAGSRLLAQPDRAIATADKALTLTADEPTNTLIAVGEPRALAQLASILASLDIRQPQVMLEVLLVSLTDSQSLALGVELERLAKSGDTQIRLSSLFGISTVNSTSPTPPPGGTGGTITVLSPGDFSVVVRALETLNQGRSLSMPRILVGNNQKGEFNAVTQQPVATTVTPSSQVTTTSFGGYEPAGTTVSVQPQIGEGDHLTLNYNVTLSSFSGSSVGGLPPPRQESRLQSQVTIPDAYTVAVGGIELTTSSDGNTQIPILGELPVVGELFKNRSASQNRTRFFAFIRAEVLRREGFEDLKYASDRASTAASVTDDLPDPEPLILR